MRMLPPLHFCIKGIEFLIEKEGVRNVEIRQRLLFDMEKLIAPAGYCNAGFPNYNTLFGRDSLITAWQLLSIRPEIAQKTLRILARYQARHTDVRKESEPGKILHEYRLDKRAQKQLPHWGWPYYGSVDSTSLYLIVLEEYVKQTSDEKLLAELWPAACAAMQWHLARAKEHPDGLIVYQRRNPHGLFHQGWKDSFDDHLGIMPPVAIIEEQGYAYCAVQAFYRLAQNFPRDKKLAQRGIAMAQRIKQSTLDKLWMNESDYFALGLGGDGVVRQSIASNAGHLLLANNFLDKAKADAVVRRLFASDMWTIGGIRTLSSQDARFDPRSYHCGSVWPHDNWMIYKGLCMLGYAAEARMIRDALLHAFDRLDCIPELYAVVRNSQGQEKISPIDFVGQLAYVNKPHLNSVSANLLQAWAIGALLNML